MMINTNFIPDGKGKLRGRQYIVEFGNYWNKVDNSPIEPQDILERG